MSDLKLDGDSSFTHIESPVDEKSAQQAIMQLAVYTNIINSNLTNLTSDINSMLARFVKLEDVHKEQANNSDRRFRRHKQELLDKLEEIKDRMGNGNNISQRVSNLEGKIGELGVVTDRIFEVFKKVSGEVTTADRRSIETQWTLKSITKAVGIFVGAVGLLATIATMLLALMQIKALEEQQLERLLERERKEKLLERQDQSFYRTIYFTNESRKDKEI